MSDDAKRPRDAKRPPRKIPFNPRPERQRAHDLRYYERNREAVIAKAVVGTTQRRADNKRRLQEYKTGLPCLDCGGVFPPVCLDFDHVGDDKFKQVSHMLNYSWRRIMEEIKKCELVCANCHRIRTASRSEGTKMLTSPYGEGYFERAEGSNYLNYGDDPGFLTIAAVMRTLLPADSKVLEEACAKGYFVKHARSLRFDAYGFDVSEYAISKAVPEAVPFVQVADALSVPWPDDVFDAVVSWEFLEHLSVDTISLVLREIERVAKPGALTIHRIGIIRTDGRFPEGEDHDHTHTLMRDDAWWRTTLHMRGWTRMSEVETQFDEVFNERDWSGRFYVYQLPKE